MKISEIMSRDVTLASPDDTIQHAARQMRDIDAGSLPVGEGDRLVGMVTDRDLVIRALAEGRAPDTPVRDVMSSELCYVYEDENTDSLGDNFINNCIRRFPVVNRDKRLVGIVSIGDLASRSADRRNVAAVMSAVSSNRQG
ncbi:MULTISPECIES: CBS domain-containing protein [unclassified Azospirillum]|uniref:CBS domain-containing protein n=1 Tax=unclassified Azospirillum TaxID=2630922 RepID=UPI000B6CF446|nr:MULTISPECIES: CBS domain-containing protein [unclassified Azospirillum]SNS11020.1 CBS domain-containing protein [Azospirillum sp. RU38E]SNS27726.1 CBS domain-containing protein [Azospirillum sp. RU37A]